MSTEISLLGLGLSEGEPRVIDYRTEMGFSGLLRTLKYVSEAREDLLAERETNLPGFRQFLVMDLPALTKHIQENPHTWDSVGLGFLGAISLMEEKSDLVWWFHVES